MTFLAPFFLTVGALAALGVVALHFLSTREPKTDLLPTVRFIPDLPVRASAVTIRFQDKWLMVLRLILVALVALALARPFLKPTKEPVARIVAVDLSRAVGNPAELADSAKKYLDGATSVILFDSKARVTTNGSSDIESFAKSTTSFARPRGSLSSALIAARRNAAKVRDQADSLELVIVSPFAEEERDGATAAIRQTWPGRIQLVQVAAATVPNDQPAAKVEWADSGASQFWTAREKVDTIGGARSGEAVMVFPFERKWKAAVQVDSATKVIGRWIDGEPAVIERVSENGCVRSSAVAIPSVGDVSLRPDFVRFRASLSSPCVAGSGFTPLLPEYLDGIKGTGPLAPTQLIDRRVITVTPWVPWLLAIALGLAIFEIFFRRKSTARFIDISKTDNDVSRAA